MVNFPPRQNTLWGMPGLFIALCLYGLLWIWQGFNLVDDGPNLSRQWLIFNGLSNVWDYVWLSRLAGGAWLWLTEPLGLIGARLGWVVVIGLTGTAAYGVLRREIKPRLAFWALIAVALAASFNGQMAFNYKTFPSLLVFSAVFFLINAAESDSNSAKIWAILGGALLGFSFLSRISFFLVLPLVFVIPLWSWERKHAPQRWHLAWLGFASALVAIALGICFLYTVNGLDAYGFLIKFYLTANHEINEGHSASQLLNNYLIQLSKVSHVTLYAAILIALEFLVLEMNNTKIITWIIAGLCVLAAYFLLGWVAAAVVLSLWCMGLVPVHFIASLILSIFAAVLLFRYIPQPLGALSAPLPLLFVLIMRWQPAWQEWLRALFFGVALIWLLVYYGFKYHHLLPGICLGMAALEIILMFARPSLRLRMWRKLLLLIVGVYIAVACAVGSTGGFASTSTGLWILLPVSFLFLPDSFAMDGAVRLLQLGRLTKYSLVFLGVIALLGAYTCFDKGFREEASRWELRYPLKHARLKCIYTTKQAASEYNKLFDVYSSKAQYLEPVLAYSRTPLVYFITFTVPALGYSWPDILWIGVLKAHLAEFGHNHPFPKLALRSLERLDNNSQKKMISQWLAEHRYRVVWSSKNYELLELFND